MKNKLFLTLALVAFASLPVLAQLPPRGQLPQTYGDKGDIQIGGNADQLFAMDHNGFSMEVKTLSGDSSVTVTPGAGTMALSAKLAVQKTSSTGTVTAAIHSLVELSGVSPAVALPTAVGNGGDRIVVANVAGSGSATFTVVSAQTINGASAGSFTLAHGASTELLSDGSNWVSVPQLGS
jgi:hypothetical protein